MFLSACDSVYNQGMRLTLEYMAGALLVVLSFFFCDIPLRRYTVYHFER